MNMRYEPWLGTIRDTHTKVVVKSWALEVYFMNMYVFSCDLKYAHKEKALLSVYFR